MNFIKISTYIFIIVVVIYTVIANILLINDSKKKVKSVRISPCPDDYMITLNTSGEKICKPHPEARQEMPDAVRAALADASFKADDYTTYCQKYNWKDKNKMPWNGVKDYEARCEDSSEPYPNFFYDTNFIYLNDRNSKPRGGQRSDVYKKREQRKFNADKNYKIYPGPPNYDMIKWVFILLCTFILVIYPVYIGSGYLYSPKDDLIKIIYQTFNNIYFSFESGVKDFALTKTLVKFFNKLGNLVKFVNQLSLTYAGAAILQSPTASLQRVGRAVH